MNPNNIYVSAVMPCLDEERTIGLCIEKALACFTRLGIKGEVIVADNGSTDGSIRIAELLGARVVHERRKGYGAALMAGINAAQGKIVVMADSDASYDWLAMGDFIQKIEEGYDLVVGNRFRGGIEPGAMPPLHRYLGNPVLSAITRWMYHIPIGDFHCGMRAFTQDAYCRMKLRTPGMEFATEMVVYAAQARLQIGEIPIRLYPDQRNRPPHLRSFRDGWRHLRFIATYAPDYLYIAPGGLLAASGLIGLIGLANGPITLAHKVFGIHFLALASLIFLCGSNLLIFGLVAKAYQAHRHPLPDSSITRFLKNFSLEKGILAATILCLLGMASDLRIFFQWIERDHGSMNDTVHLAFVSTTTIILGIQIMFASFLLNMLQERQ